MNCAQIDQLRATDCSKTGVGATCPQLHRPAATGSAAKVSHLHSNHCASRRTHMFRHTFATTARRGRPDGLDRLLDGGQVRSQHAGPTRLRSQASARRPALTIRCAWVTVSASGGWTDSGAESTGRYAADTHQFDALLLLAGQQFDE